MKMFLVFSLLYLCTTVAVRHDARRLDPESTVSHSEFQADPSSYPGHLSSPGRSLLSVHGTSHHRGRREGKQSRDGGNGGGGSAAEVVDSLIASHTVMVFSKSYCPYSKRVKRLFDDAGVAYHAVELDQRGDGRSLQDALFVLTGGRTVPRVFVAGEHIGGNDNTQAEARSGALQTKLRAAGVEYFGW